MNKIINVIGKKPLKSFNVYIRLHIKGTNKSNKYKSECLTIRDYTGKLESKDIVKVLERGLR